ncbi:S-formylglutathione hydrolase isoform X2 [Nilaparvata lugens]|nr:S-formylglutathione hydrolase isoform X2 [Nilaparvata lugens]
MALKEVSSSKCFGGYQKVFSHDSKELKCRMNFAIYLPAETTDSQRVPVIYWLSGLECNELNYVQKAGGQRFASEHGIAVVCPDTSPRGCGIEGEDDRWDFGTAAGFYLDATREPWATNYRMYSYVTQELPQLITQHFPALDTSRQSIMGHRWVIYCLSITMNQLCQLN